MAEKTNVTQEKIYFKYILDNPEQFIKVDPHFFKNEDIKFVYDVIRENYLVSKHKVVPSPNQTLAMVKLNSDVRTIEKNKLGMLMKHNNDNYTQEWLEEKFKSWKLSNKVKDNVMKSIDVLRNIDESDYDKVKEAAGKVKNMIHEVDLIDDDDTDLGADFDDPSTHRQDETVQKISTGWKCLDNMLNGGWDYQSLVVLIGETNVGKCHSSLSSLSLRRLSSKTQQNMAVGKFFEMVENIDEKK
jgi:hypothetical protein